MTTPTMAVGRPGGMTLGGGKGNWKGRATQILAWVSFALGVTAGSLLASTFFGGFVDNIVGFGPWDWVPVLILAGLFVFVAVDLFSDMVPNRLALYSVMSMPSVARGVDGSLGTHVESWANSVRDALQGNLSDLLGTSSAIGLAGAAALVAWIVARRTMKAKAG